MTPDEVPAGRWPEGPTGHPMPEPVIVEALGVVPVLGVSAAGAQPALLMDLAGRVNQPPMNGPHQEDQHVEGRWALSAGQAAELVHYIALACGVSDQLRDEFAAGLAACAGGGE